MDVFHACRQVASTLLSDILGHHWGILHLHIMYALCAPMMHSEHSVARQGLITDYNRLSPRNDLCYTDLTLHSYTLVAVEINYTWLAFCNRQPSCFLDCTNSTILTVTIVTTADHSNPLRLHESVCDKPRHTSRVFRLALCYTLPHSYCSALRITTVQYCLLGGVMHMTRMFCV